LVYIKRVDGQVIVVGESGVGGTGELPEVATVQEVAALIALELAYFSSCQPATVACFV